MYACTVAAGRGAGNLWVLVLVLVLVLHWALAAAALGAIDLATLVKLGATVGAQLGRFGGGGVVRVGEGWSAV